jgi:multiple sugar transport system permease protein
MAALRTAQPAPTRPKPPAAAMRTAVVRAAVTSLALVILLLYLMPLGYSIVTSLKSKAQVSDVNAPVLPSAPETFTFEGRDYDVYTVPTEDGDQRWALVQPGRTSSMFVDPANPEAGLFEWEGRWRTLAPAYRLAFQWSNYPTAFQFIDFLRLLGYTFMYAGITTVAATISAAIVAYGFARFKFPFQNVLFIVLISTIILPPQVTLVPTYAFFFQLGWVGTWLPLIVPQFFSNAYNVFLLRQYFMTIPTSLEEAARIDGAGPIRTFVSVILPQAVPALIAVSLFHFFFAWNDFFGPLIYLAGSADINPIAVGLFRFNGLYSSEPQLIQAASILTMIIPLLIFFFAQRFFMQGIVLTGDK